METTRLILFIALGLVLVMLWEAWQEDYGAKAPSVASEQMPSLPAEQTANDVPSVTSTATPPDELRSLPSPDSNILAQGETVSVKTDVLDIRINTVGGTIEQAALLQYPIEKDQPDSPVLLLKNESNEFYWIQSGLLSKSDSANHKTIYSARQRSYSLADNESIEVALEWQSETGLKVVKTYVFYRGAYVADLKHQVINASPAEWTGSAYAQINRTDPAEAGSRLLYTYTGAVLSSPEQRYEKIDFGDIQEERLSQDISNGWAAMLQHYFFTALLPGDSNETYHYYTLNPDNKSYVIGAVTPGRAVSAGSTETFNQRLYFGPKLQKTLNQLAEGLELTVDYGIFWFIAKPLYWVLDFIHTYTNNWGWSIVLVTLLLKVLFYRLSAAGYRSMANMRRVQPRLVAIKERYQNDRARLNQAMMDIYKQEKINPLGGCFPILIQIPVFISLYWVLLETVELRQAEFALWINDLSAPDPFFVLPLVMGVTMFIQQKLNPAPMDPVQEKVMSILPIVFTVFFAFFPSGLVLYWVVNNILSIAQQWLITRNLEKAK